MECGRVVVRRVDDDDDSNGAGEEDEEEDDSAVEIGLPELVKPGFSEFVMFEKQVGAVPSKIIWERLRERACPTLRPCHIGY